MRYLLPATFLLLAPVAALGCGDDDAAACGSDPSLEILAPVEGAEITMADDADAAMGGLQVRIDVLACGFERDDFVEVWVTSPFESRYAVLMVEDSPMLSATVSLVPGDITMEARGPDGMVISEPVSFHVTVD